MSIIIGTIIFWVISLIFIPLDFLIYCLRSKAFPFFLIAGIFSPALARWLYFISLNKIGASKSSSILATGPAFSAIIAIAFLEEHLTIPISLGIVFTILGIIFFERDLRKKERSLPFFLDSL
jgi:drug/metabolite transporter (DMT)-like permease